ncbi:Inosamine-phosphate amidinotransferase 1 [Seminavis robusta]|uniref:Glycine amidinotransferase, mitochondrial n=1 Tax=Seminavis robusta TaxID=568900 RepID=A0A9N8HUC9_9STRA|nr:Inosamine-phosphate amidinotransferase 1 [Seminavis robusta]|eukprot:Sro2044_g312380.1 Inosamine-phosphate amidinotransferase 1 (333) ;mRNA; r:7120-8118
MSSSNNTEATVQKLVIRNNHEWDPLEEVVVGLWVPNTLRMPTIEESVKATFPYITQEAWDYLGKAENKLLSEAYPADDQLFCDEQEALVQALQSLGVKVRRPDEIEFPVIATSSCYSRDPIVTIGNKTIITNMNLENRRQETPSYRRIALELATQYNGTVVSMPPNKAGYPDSNAYLEGGDVFVDGKDIYVGVTGNASNDNGIAWLREELGSDYTVHKVPLNSNVLHLDCAMMLINERQGLICKEDFVDFDALPDRLKNRQWVEVEPKQAQVMATNGICVNPTTIMMRKGFTEVAEKVRAIGVEVIELDFKKADYFGGGLRCSYQPIRRKEA